VSLLRCVLCGNLPRWGLFGKHEELENLASYLISDQSEFITANSSPWTAVPSSKAQAQSMPWAIRFTDEQWKAIKPKKT